MLNIDYTDFEDIESPFPKFQNILINNLDSISLIKKKIKILKSIHCETIILNLNADSWIEGIECKKLLDLKKYLKKQGINLQVYDGGVFELESLISSRSQLNEIIKIINTSKIEKENNRPLNDLEKFLLAYSFVANRKYKENKAEPNSSRTLISILNSEDIVCVGFSKLLKYICDRIGIRCYCNMCNTNTSSENQFRDHQNNIVILDGAAYYCDACWDCVNTNKDVPSFAFSLLTPSMVSDMKVISNCSVYFYDHKDSVKCSGYISVNYLNNSITTKSKPNKTYNVQMMGKLYLEALELSNAIKKSVEINEDMFYQALMNVNELLKKSEQTEKQLEITRKLKLEYFSHINQNIDNKLLEL